MRLTHPKVTGVNGFLGAHVVDQLVQKGSRVRGYAIAQIIVFVVADSLGRTVRGAKLAVNREVYQNIYGSAVDIVAVDDLIKGDFTTALQGEGKVIYTCWPSTDTLLRCRCCDPCCLSIVWSRRCGVDY